MSKEHYDIIVIGSGLGGLICATVLAKEGKKVLVLEKNNQLGGNLQTFSRNKCIFDTGVHYIGGLAKGQNLHHYFSYLGIMDSLRLEQMDLQAFDRISFDNDKNEYPYGQSETNFVDGLASRFPEERENIRKFYRLMEACCQGFPLYNLASTPGYQNMMEEAGKPITEVIASITANETLRAVLAGTNILYAGEPNQTPFYVHALSVYSYISSAWRCSGGGSQIAKLLSKQIRKNGGKILKYKEVTHIETRDKKVVGIQSQDGQQFTGNLFISNINPKKLLSLMQSPPIRKASINRIQQARDTVSSFSVFLVLKSKQIPYINHNIYHFKNKEQVWGAIQYEAQNWPGGYMLSMTPDPKNPGWAQSITAFTYMRFEEVEQWADSISTVSNPNQRNSEYEAFKQEKAAVLISEIEKKIPQIRRQLQHIYTATPLTYRDYIGSYTGDMYGFTKVPGEPLMNYFPVQTKVSNLLQTGQHISMHGILGVTLSAIQTCFEILDREYLINKINAAGNPSGI